MTLYELVNGTCVQGDVRLSVWDNDEEVKTKEFTGFVDDLAYAIIPKDMMDLEIQYIFAPGDGFLHIDLVPKED